MGDSELHDVPDAKAFFLGAVQNAIKDPHWYAVKGSDTTMLPRAASFAGVIINKGSTAESIAYSILNDSKNLVVKLPFLNSSFFISCR